MSTRITLAELPPVVTELLAAITEALTVPLPAIADADERAYHRLLERRTTDVRIYLATMLDFAGVDISVDAVKLRARTAATPVTYGLYEDEQAKVEERENTRCGRCRRPFDPADTRFDGHARHRETPWCRRCIDNCHEGSAEHVCVICDPKRYGGEGR